MNEPTDEKQKAILSLLDWQARDLLKREERLRQDSSSLDIDERLLVYHTKTLLGDNPKFREHDFTPIILERNDPKYRENELDELIDRAMEYVRDEYKNGKHDGREIRCLFGALFELIGREAKQKFDKKIPQ